MAVSAVEPERAGLASGVLNTARQFGAAVGLAALVSVGASVARTEWTDHVQTLGSGVQARAEGLAPLVAGGDVATVAHDVGPAQQGAASDAFASGMRVAMLASGGLIVVVALLTALGGGRPPPAVRAGGGAASVSGRS